MGNQEITPEINMRYLELYENFDMNEGRLTQNILRDLYRASDEDEAAKFRAELTKTAGWTENDIDYMLQKFVKDNPNLSKNKPVVAPKTNWNQIKYDDWISSVASGGGAEHSYDMAQNALHEPGLIDWVKKNLIDDETPLERIQWDIEAHA